MVSPRYYTYYEPATWRACLDQAGFEVVSFEAMELDPEQASASCNLGARGWINALVRQPHE